MQRLFHRFARVGGTLAIGLFLGLLGFLAYDKLAEAPAQAAPATPGALPAGLPPVSSTAPSALGTTPQPATPGAVSPSWLSMPPWLRLPDVNVGVSVDGTPLAGVQAGGSTAADDSRTPASAGTGGTRTPTPPAARPGLGTTATAASPADTDTAAATAAPVPPAAAPSVSPTATATDADGPQRESAGPVGAWPRLLTRPRLTASILA